MLIDAQRSMLLVIDLQQKMLPAIADGAEILANCTWLIRAAQKLGVPVAACEQYPKGLGPLVAPVRELLPDNAIAAKNRFSVVAAACLTDLPAGDRAQAILIGIVSREMVVFEWLEEAGTPLFGAVNKEFLKA